MHDVLEDFCYLFMCNRSLCRNQPVVLVSNPGRVDVQGKRKHQKEVHGEENSVFEAVCILDAIIRYVFGAFAPAKSHFDASCLVEEG